MDALSLITSIPGVGPYIPWITLGITICTALCPLLKAPATTSGVYYLFYQAINTVALNFGHAKNLSAPESKGVVGGPGAIVAPQMSTASVPKP